VIVNREGEIKKYENMCGEEDKELGVREIEVKICVCIWR